MTHFTHVSTLISYARVGPLLKSFQPQELPLHLWSRRRNQRTDMTWSACCKLYVHFIDVAFCIRTSVHLYKFELDSFWLCRSNIELRPDRQFIFAVPTPTCVAVSVPTSDRADRTHSLVAGSKYFKTLPASFTSPIFQVRSFFVRLQISIYICTTFFHICLERGKNFYFAFAYFVILVCFVQLIHTSLSYTSYTTSSSNFNDSYTKLNTI